MADHTPYPIQLVTPEGVEFEGEGQLLLVTSQGGSMGFYARHAPLVADLKIGHVRLQMPDDSWRVWATSEGFAKVHDSTGTVLVEEAVEADRIDVDEARELIESAKAELAQAEAGATATPDDDPQDAVYKADARKAQRNVEWGENLLAVHEQYATSK